MGNNSKPKELWYVLLALEMETQVFITFNSDGVLEERYI